MLVSAIRIRYGSKRSTVSVDSDVGWMIGTSTTLCEQQGWVGGAVSKVSIFFENRFQSSGIGGIDISGWILTSLEMVDRGATTMRQMADVGLVPPPDRQKTTENLSVHTR